MHRLSPRVGRILGFTVIAWAMVLCHGAISATDTRQASASARNELWQQSIDLVGRGDFEGAVGAIRKIQDGGHLTEQVRTWLEEYEAQQVARRELDRADLEKYVGYAKQRIERKEYAMALEWALAAADCVEDREAFLHEEWLEQLVNDSLIAAEKARKDSDWKEAWRLYNPLATLYDREPRYQKLEREVLTHLRLETVFEEEGLWKERIEKVRWEDAERAMEFVGLYYVELADFKAMTEAGLEQMLLLAESPAAQKAFTGLGNENDRNDFTARIRRKLEYVQAAPSLDWDEATKHFRRVRDINEQTVDLPEELLISELMRGAFEPLDDFTTIIWPQDAVEFHKHTRGDFIGVGVSIVKDRVTDEIEVVSPLEDTPAYRAGIQAGDIITKVDGKEIKNLSLNKVVDTITGPRGTPVVLTIRRGEEEIEFPLKRDRVKIQSVKGYKRNDDEEWNHWLDRENGIGYIRITNFQKNTEEDVRNVLADLEDEDSLKGLVLDLRNNPGGLLESAWRLSSLFLKRGDVVVSTRGRNPAENHTFNARRDGPYADLPLTVLVDEHSASASEILAGAIKDNNHGQVVGARTFGKFSVQNLIPLSRSQAELKLTTARYYLPSGVSLHRDPDSDKWGVEPDIPVRLVRWERYNTFLMRRDAERIGPPKPEKDEDEEDAAKTGDEDPDSESGDKSATAEDDKGDGEEPKAGEDAKNGEDTKDGEDAEADGDSEEDKLPKLEQKDENNRPKEDPQLDTALLVMRVKLLGASSPTIAAVEPSPSGEQLHR